MKDPGEYALLAANGMPWKDVVALIRDEVLRDAHCGEGCTGWGCTFCNRDE